MSQKIKYYLLMLIIVLSVILMLLLPAALLLSMGDDLAGLVTDPSTGPSGTTATTAAPTVPTTDPTTVPTTTPPTTAAPTEPPVVKEGTFTLSATGDMLMHSPIFNAAATGSGYDFSQLFRFFADYVSSADYAVGNLETTLAGLDNGYEYSGYPNFNCPDSIIDGMKNAGFDLVLTANNHSYDTRTVGLTRTPEIIADRGLDFLGTQMDAEEPDYLLVERNGVTLGLMCYTYEGDDKKENIKPEEISPNGHLMTPEDALCISSFDYRFLNLFYDEIENNIAEMKALGAEATVLFIHWGQEYHTEQNSTQSAMAQKLCDLGIDVIIGGHPHVVQPVEVLTSNEDESHKTVCLYSMGNAVSNQRRQHMNLNTGHTEDGVLFSVTFAKYSDGTVILESVDLLPTWVYLGTSPVTGEWEYNILPLDDSVTDWYSQMQLTDSMYQSCKASFERTMAIVGSGMAEVDAYLAQNLADTEALLGVTNP